MSKPIVFFSHSSKDKKVLTSLKEIIQQKTGNAISIFLSSDGQSIPFGKNWVYTIEKSLEESKLCFVYLSPNSINSNWVHFESGYTYSKNIQVVPVGILGVDLIKISPPLSLLQGFNIFNKDGLNNIIEVINKTFDTKFALNFTDVEYNSIIGLSNSGINYFLDTNSFIDEFNIYYWHISANNINETLCNSFEENEIEYVSKVTRRENSNVNDKLYIRSYGIEIEYDFHQSDIVMKLDKDHIHRYVKILDLFGSSIKYQTGSMSISFILGTKCIHENHKRTAKLFNSPIKIVDSQKLSFDNLIFSLWNYNDHSTSLPIATIQIEFITGVFSQMKVNELVRMLFDLNVVEIINY